MVLAIIPVFVFIVFRSFFSSLPLIGHDWPVVFSEAVRGLSGVPQAWSQLLEGGFGGSTLPVLWVDSYYQFVFAVFTGVFGFPFALVERIFFVFPWCIGSILGSYVLIKHVLKSRVAASIGVLVYVVNTYILMILSGGQVHIAIAYGITPWTWYFWLRVFEQSRKRMFFSRPGIAFAFAFNVQVLFDVRIAFVNAFALGLYCAYIFFSRNTLKRQDKTIIVYPVIFTAVSIILIQSFWLLPLALHRQNAFGGISSGLKTGGDASFYSFGTLSHSLSLLHPNWPENIFGKVYFFRPEFLLIPLLAFTGLLMVKVRQYKSDSLILFFAGLAVLGSLLSTGMREPLGAIYAWMFRNIPGFSLFRDPTKFYVLTALCYSVLIPFSLIQMWDKIRTGFPALSKVKKHIPLVFIIAWGALHYQAFSGLPGFLRAQAIPASYIELKNTLSAEREFFRILWVPERSRYAYASVRHPFVSVYSLFGTAGQTDVLNAFVDDSADKTVSQAGIKYVVVIDDVFGEFFTKDRSYDPQFYEHTVHVLDSRPWLKRKHTFGKIVVYEVNGYEPLFSVLNRFGEETDEVKYSMIKPTEYHVQVPVESVELVMRQTYDPGWEILSGSGQTHNAEQAGNYLRFPLSNERSYRLVYKPQQWVVVGLVLSGLTVFGLVWMLLYETYNLRKK